MEDLPGASVFLDSPSTPFTDVCSVHINWVKAETSLQIVKIWGWTSKQNVLRFPTTTDYATIFRSYNCFTQETEREKNENNLEGKRINFAISLFTFLVASVESKRGGKQTRTRALQEGISGYFH